MTTKLYLDDTYQSHAQANVVESGQDERGPFLVLDQTIFYPQGGGQPSDTGRIMSDGQEIPVITVRKNMEGQVRHYVAELPSQNLAGKSVELEIDSEKRLVHAKLHSGGHLLSLIAEKIHPEIKGVKGHHFPGEAYVEFDKILEDTDELTKNLNNLMDQAIADDLKVACKVVEPDEFKSIFGYEPRDGSLRMAILGDLPPVPCGGTHVASLKELGKVTVTKIKNKKGRMKISYSV